MCYHKSRTAEKHIWFGLVLTVRLISNGVIEVGQKHNKASNEAMEVKKKNRLMRGLTGYDMKTKP